MGMLADRSGSALKVTPTVTVPPSATLYEVAPNDTDTCGSSSSVMLTVVSLGVPALTSGGRVPKVSCTLSPSSSTVSCVAEKVKVFGGSPRSSRLIRVRRAKSRPTSSSSPRTSREYAAFFECTILDRRS